MEKTELLRKYELVIILDAKLPTDDKEGIIKSIKEVVEKASGKVINSQVWLEKQKFTFEIKNQTEGTYYLINFEAEGDVAPKVRASLRLNEKILRFTITKAE